MDACSFTRGLCEVVLRCKWTELTEAEQRSFADRLIIMMGGVIVAFPVRDADGQ